MSGHDPTPYHRGFGSIVLFQNVVPSDAFTQYRSPVYEPTKSRSPDIAGVETPPKPPIGLYQIISPVISFKQYNPSVPDPPIRFATYTRPHAIDAPPLMKQPTSAFQSRSPVTGASPPTFPVRSGFKWNIGYSAAAGSRSTDIAISRATAAVAIDLAIGDTSTPIRW
jgi:hypothetical protein